jgi:Protein of unknown function (DUF1064)
VEGIAVIPVRLSPSLTGYRDSPAAKRQQKYSNARIVDPDGTKFDSKAEHKYWHYLKLREKAKEIFNLERQVVYELAPGVTIGSRKRPPLRYIADMRWNEGSPAGKLVVADVKGAVTPEYRIKRHLMASVHGIEIMEIRA